MERDAVQCYQPVIGLSNYNYNDELRTRNSRRRYGYLKSTAQQLALKAMRDPYSKLFRE